MNAFYINAHVTGLDLIPEFLLKAKGINQGAANRLKIIFVGQEPYMAVPINTAKGVFMKTHTIRNSKDKTCRIISFTPEFKGRLLESEEYAISALLSKLLAYLKRIPLKEHVLDAQQFAQLTVHTKKEAFSTSHYSLLPEAYHVSKMFLDGYKFQPLLPLDKELEILNSFVNNFLKGAK